MYPILPLLARLIVTNPKKDLSHPSTVLPNRPQNWYKAQDYTERLKRANSLPFSKFRASKRLVGKTATRVTPNNLSPCRHHTMNQTENHSLDQLIALVRRLRAPDGCPWDRKQTPQTFKRYLLEETHELLEAINDNQPTHIREELGDLLFQLVFLAILYEEQGLFTLDDAIGSITAKMIRRHPHVFASATVESEQELRRQWQTIKDQENCGTARKVHPLDAIPRSMPALLRAQRVGDRVARHGFDWPDLAQAFAKVEEEFKELQTALHTNQEDAFAEEFGDLLFALVIAGRKAKIDSEETLNAATEKFITRYQRLEGLVSESGSRVEDCDLPTLLATWTKAKSEPPPDQKTIDRQGDTC